MKRTEFFTHNIRRETVPGLTEEQYESILNDKETEVSEESLEYLIAHGYATSEPKRKPKSKE